MAISSATTELVIVPDSSTPMPKWASENSGVHWVSVRKSTIDTAWKKTIDSLTSTYTMPSVVNTDTHAAASSTISMAFSRRWRLALDAAYSASFAAPERVGAEVTLITSSDAVVVADMRGNSAAQRASRACSASMVMPTSATPPNTEPFLPLARCSRLVV